MDSEAIRAAASKFIQAGVKQGLNATSIIGMLQQSGFTYRRTDMLADIRSYAGLPSKIATFKYVGLNKFPDLISMQMGGNFMSKQYRYDVEIQAYVEGGDDLTKLNRTVSSTVPLTRQQAADLAIQNEGLAEGSPEKVVYSASTTMGYYRPDVLEE